MLGELPEEAALVTSSPAAQPLLLRVQHVNLSHHVNYVLVSNPRVTNRLICRIQLPT